MSASTVLYSHKGASSLSLQAAQLLKFKIVKSSKDDGLIYIKARCTAGGGESAIKRVNLKKIKNSKTASSEKTFLSTIKSRIKIK